MAGAAGSGHPDQLSPLIPQNKFFHETWFKNTLCHTIVSHPSMT